MIALLLAHAALAANVDVKICVKVVNDYADSDVAPPLRYVMDDFLSDNTVARALGGVMIELNAIGGYDWRFAEEDGPDVGCADFTIDDQKAWTISIVSYAHVNGHYLRLYDDHTTPQLFQRVFYPTIWQPQDGQTYTRTHQTGTERTWDLFNVAAWALHHRDLGLPDQYFTAYYENCPGDANQCYSPVEDAIFVDSSFRVNTAHEMGHYLLYRKLGDGANARNDAWNYDCHSGTTSGHDLQQREFAAEAFWEGWANFYAAVTFNNKNHNDCYLEYYKQQDWDLDRRPGQPDPEPRTTNCRGVPWTRANGVPLDTADTGYNPAVGAQDYLYDSHAHLNCAQGASMDNRATELDYIRFWWEMYATEGMSMSEIADVIALAEPSSFYPGADPEADPLDTGTDVSDWPSVRLQDAGHAYDSQHSTNWGFPWAFGMNDHGLHR